MIPKQEIDRIAKNTDLNLYQQEKDYLLKLFLYNYYRKYKSAVFKGGTCIRYLFGLNRFSEDLDFELRSSEKPKAFKKEVEKTLDEIEKVGIDNHFIKLEEFEHAFTCEVAFHGPLYQGTSQTRNKFRIDAGHRTKIVKDPRWELMNSEYPETRNPFLVQSMHPEEILVEKIISLMERTKGRDLYDCWFLLKKGIELHKDLLEKKYEGELTTGKIPSEEEYNRDLKRLVSNIVPYKQVKGEVEKALEQPL